jgi:nucleoside-diphosphate-sugar epimerase
MKARILVTGATGFVGQALCHFLLTRGYQVRGAVRRITEEQRSGVGNSQQGNIDFVNVGEILPAADWSQALHDVDTVVHLAARVHVYYDNMPQSLDAYRQVNSLGTANLARQAAAAGVRRFVYLSTAKVNGEGTSFFNASANRETQAVFSEADIPHPQGGYAISKWEAEQQLQHVSSATGMESVIVRPPLIYGEGVKANFMRLLKWIDKGIPLPFGGLANKRSLLSLDNLLDFLVLCIHAPAAANETFLVADDDALSTPELIRRIALYMHRPARLPIFPSWLIKLVARLAGKSSEIDKICGSLQVDIGKAKEVLQWKPSITIDQGLEKTVLWYLQEKNK